MIISTTKPDFVKSMADKAKIKNLLLGAILLLISLLATSGSNAQVPVAAFSMDTMSGCAPLTVQFTNNSVNATSFHWDFGNGNTSVLQNPVNIYLYDGLYSVSLIVAGVGGSSDTLTLVDVIKTISKPVVGFTVQNTSSCLDGNIFSFTDTTSQAAYWLWDFGDGYISTQQDPLHTYDMAGTYTVTLIAGNNDSCEALLTKSSFITVFTDWQTEVLVDTTEACDVSHAFVFSCPTSGAISWEWDFGDGTTSSQQSPSHLYLNPGQYTVTFSAINSNGCSDTLVLLDFIKITNVSQLGIGSDLTSGCTPLTINFVDSSSASTSWLWNFGDGTTSTDSNPSHIFGTAGVYDLSLTISNSHGCTFTTVLNDYINAQDAPQASFLVSFPTGCSPLAIKFGNLSSNSTSWLWDFGDSTTSTLKNPYHTYITPGLHTVKLIAYSNNMCADIFIIPDLIDVLDPIAKFRVNSLNGCAPLSVTFQDLSINATQWLWYFDDGNMATQQQPVHTYSDSGSFNPYIIVSNGFGCSDTAYLDESIEATINTPPYITPDTYTGCAPFSISFEDNTAGATGWNWNFGDGSQSNSKQVLHTFLTAGNYNVSLEVESKSGCNQYIPNHSTFIIEDGEADFLYELDICDQRIVTYKDSSSNAVSWTWNFGDSTFSTEPSPTHEYEQYGRYVVTLEITTNSGCKFNSSQMISVKPKGPIAQPFFVASDSLYPMTISFYASFSRSPISWYWDLGDGSTSALENPVHYYTSSPTFNISLVVVDSICVDTIIIEIPDAITPGFSFGGPGEIEEIQFFDYQVNGCAPFQVHFNNDFADYISFDWDFGDGSGSTEANPVHTYSSPGVYSVTEIAISSSGQIDTMVLIEYFAIGGTTASFTYTGTVACDSILYAFIDSSEEAVKWDWNFGDGTMAAIKSPSHAYPTINTSYMLSLIVMDSTGCTDGTLTSIYTGISEPQLSYVGSTCSGDTVHFDVDIMGVSTWSWNFGDSVFSTDSSPSHVYTNEGAFGVVLDIVLDNGCSKRLEGPDSIIVHDPLANFIITGNSEACDFLTLAITNTSTNASDFLWDFGDGTTSTENSPVKHYGNPGQYSLTLIAAYQGCEHTKFVNSGAVVNAAVSDFVFVQSNYCLPISSNMTDLSPAAITWSWDFGDGSPLDTTHMPSHLFTTVPLGDITLTITDTNNCTATVSKPNIGALTTDFNVANTKGCTPFNAVFTDQSSNAVSWAWDFGDGSTIDTMKNPMHNYSSNGAYTVKLAVQSIDGCTDSIQFNNLISTFKPTANFISADAPQCAPSLVSLTDSSQNVNFWNWSFGDGSGSSNKDPQHIYVLPGSYTVSLIVTDSIGCSDTLVKTGYVGVLGPIASFTSDGTEGCEGLELNFSDQSTDAISWEWNFGNGNVDSTKNPQVFFTEPGSYPISLIVEDTFGCSSLHVLTDSILIHKIPEAVFLLSDTIGCSPYRCSFNNLSQSGENYLWNFGDSIVDTLKNPEHLYQVGNYAVSLIATSDFGCSDTTYSNIVVLQSPLASFESSTIEGCYPLSLNLISSSSDLEEPSYLWSFGLGQISTTDNPSVTLKNTGYTDVSLIVTNVNGCADTSFRPAYIEVYDTLAPKSSPVFTATVRSNTEIQFIWEPSAIVDFEYYTVFRMDPFSKSYIKIATIEDQSINEFIDDGLNTLQNTYCYKIQTTDQCGNQELLINLTAYCTMNVSSQTTATEINVTWTPYQGCNIAAYQVYRIEAGEEFGTMVGEVPPSELTFTDSSIICPVPYSYRIIARALCGEHYSSLSDTTIAHPIENIFYGQHVDVARTTVVDSYSILTEWVAPAIAAHYVSGYRIFRSIDAVDFERIEILPASAHEYLDEDVEVQKQNYFYRIEVINDCEVQNDPGDQGSSILLTSEKVNDMPVLNWTPYQNWKEGVDVYIIEELDEYGNWIKVDAVGGSINHIIID